MDKANMMAYMGGIVRVITTLLGGWLTQKGWATEADVEGIAGAAILVATGLWSIYAKRKALKAIPPAVKAALALIVCSAFLSGCVAIRANSNGEGAQVWAVGFGSDSSSQLANVAVTGPGTEGTDAQTGVSFDAANSEQKTSQTIQSLVSLGAALAPVLSGVPVKAVSVAPDVSGETDAITVPEYGPVATGPLSVISGEGVPVVAILGNRATCSRCSTLWGKLDASALSESLCGASVIDADKTDNPAEYARLRPKTAFAYPLVMVFAGDGKLAGQFSANGMTQAALTQKVKALVPECVPK